MLGVLLYLKKLGNFAAHPNIKSQIEGEINEGYKNMEVIQHLVESNININNNNDDDSTLINISLKNDVKKVLNNIQYEILENFKDITFEKNAELDFILQYMFENKSQNIIRKDRAFLRAIEQEINIIINEEKDFDENILFSNFNNNMSFPKDILESINEHESYIKNKLKDLDKYNLERNIEIEYGIKSELKKLKRISFSTLPILIEKYKNKMNNSPYPEQKANILATFVKEYFESDLFIKAKKEITTKLREYIKYKVIKIKLEKIYKLIEKMFDKDIKDFDENTFINEMKNYMREINLDEDKKLYELNFGFKETMIIIKALIDEKNINWLSMSPKEETSISSYLYYMQNKK